MWFRQAYYDLMDWGASWPLSPNHVIEEFVGFPTVDAAFAAFTHYVQSYTRLEEIVPFRVICEEWTGVSGRLMYAAFDGNVVCTRIGVIKGFA